MSNGLYLSEGAQVLYTYKNEKLYFENLIHFIYRGLEKRQYIFIIENKQKHEMTLKKLLGEGLTKFRLKKLLLFDNEVFYRENGLQESGFSQAINNVKSLKTKRMKKLRLWGKVVCSKGNTECINRRIRKNDEKSFELIKKYRDYSICVYNGNVLNANEYIKQKKLHKYIMTDKELFISNLHNNDDLIPYITMKENLEEIMIELNKYKEKVSILEKFKAISEIAAFISHEVRNPMTTVRGFLKHLKCKEEYNKDSEFFKIMIDEIDRANSIITEFLSIGKEKPTKLAPNNLNKTIEVILPLLQKTALNYGKKVESNLSETPLLLLDIKEIKQVLLNLVQNGLDATPEGGKVIISTYLDNEEVVLEIKDEGKGIKPHILKKLGTPFFTTKEHGTGLGLATSYRIIDRHNGNVDIDTSSEGTTFYIRFKIN